MICHFISYSLDFKNFCNGVLCSTKMVTVFEINVQFSFPFCLNDLEPYLSNCCIILGHKDMHLHFFLILSQFKISHLDILPNFSLFAYVTYRIFLSSSMIAYEFCAYFLNWTFSFIYFKIFFVFCFHHFHILLPKEGEKNQGSEKFKGFFKVTCLRQVLTKAKSPT